MISWIILWRNPSNTAGEAPKKKRVPHKEAEVPDESSRMLFIKKEKAGEGAKGILFDKNRKAPSFQVSVRRQKQKLLFPCWSVGSVVFGSNRMVRGIICELAVWLVSAYHRCRGVSSLEWTPRSRIPLEGGRISHRLAGKSTRLSGKQTDTS